MRTPAVGMRAQDTVPSVVRLDALRRSGLLRPETFQQLDRLTELAATLTGAPVALISMVDEDRQYFTSERGLAEPWASDRETPLSHSVCKTVVDYDEPLVIAELADTQAFRDHDARLAMGVESYCGVPIHDPDGNVLGSFCVIDDGRHEWDTRTVEILQQLAALVTNAIETNRDYTALIHDLQARVLPTELVETPTGHLDARYRPIRYSDAIGGDFYDAVARRDGGFDIVVGDVVGHGVESTHAAAQLRAAARAVFTGSTASPAEVINRIARSCADLPGCENAALLVARVSADGRTVSWARAGAMPPALTGPDSRILTGGACPPLGLGQCTFDAGCQVTLKEGQGLVFFTDGLVERRGEHLDVGLQRLLTGTRDVADIDDLIEYCTPSPVQADDIALVTWMPHPA